MWIIKASIFGVLLVLLTYQGCQAQLLPPNEAQALQDILVDWIRSFQDLEVPWVSGNTSRACLDGWSGLNCTDNHITGIDLSDMATSPFCGAGCCGCQERWESRCLVLVEPCKQCAWEGPNYPGFVCEDGNYLLKGYMAGGAHIRGPTFVRGKVSVPKGSHLTCHGFNAFLGVSGPIAIQSQIHFDYTKEEGKLMSKSPSKTISYKYMQTWAMNESPSGDSVEMQTALPGCPKIRPIALGTGGEYWINAEFVACTYYWLIALFAGIAIIIFIVVILAGKLHWLQCQTKKDFFGTDKNDDPVPQQDLEDLKQTSESDAL